MGDSSDCATVFSKDALQYNRKRDFLGAGAFGTVYRAEVKRTREVVAIKVLNTPARLREREVDCLMKEVAILQRLQGCPNIIRLIGVCVNPRHYALVMEYVENGDLDELLVYKQGKHPDIMQWNCRIRMGLDVARGMDFLHGQQPRIIHGDLKSANVLVDTNYYCKIIDFGLSKSRGISSCSSSLLHHSHQNAAGTLAFVAPERFSSEAALQHPDKADVYSFSIVLWQLKEMRRPYEGESNPATVRENVVASIRPAFSRDDCPIELREFIPQCWRPQPQVRPHFSEIVTTMETILQCFVSQHRIMQQTIPSGSTGRVAVNRKLPGAYGLPSPSAVRSIASSIAPSSSTALSGPLPLSSTGTAVSPLIYNYHTFNSSPGVSVPIRPNSSTGVSVPFQPNSDGTRVHPFDLKSSAGPPVRSIAEIPASPDMRPMNPATPTLGESLGSSVGCDEIELISVAPSSKRRRLSYWEDSRRVKNLSVIPNDASKWVRWPNLPVSGMFHNNCVAMDGNTLVVANTQQVYSLNTTMLHSRQILPPFLPTPNWTIHNHFLGDGVVLHTLFGAWNFSFVTYYLNNSSDQKQRIAQFDLQKKTWTDVCDLPSYQLLQNYSIVGDQRYAYIVGGENKTCNDVYDTVLKYDLHAGKECERRKLISKRKGGSSAIMDTILSVRGVLHVGGGSDGQNYLDSMETVNLSEFTFHSGRQRQTSTETYQCSLCDDGSASLIATGGLEGLSVSKMASVLNLDEVTWSPLPAMNEGRCCHGLCKVGGYVVAVGGTGMAGSQLNSVETLSVLDIYSRCHDQIFLA